MKKLMNITIFIMCLFIFYKDAIYDEVAVLISLMNIVIIQLIFNSKKKYIDKVDILWIMCIFYCIFNLMYAPYFSYALKTSSVLISFIIIKLLLKYSVYWNRVFIKLLFIFSSINVITTIIHPINTNMIANISKKLISPDSFELMSLLATRNQYAGITGQISTNAFFITIFLSIVFLKNIYLNEKKLNNYILIVLGLIALLLTGKRGLFIANIIAMFVTIIIRLKLQNKNLINLLKYVLLGIILFVVFIKFIPAGQKMLSRFIETDDFTTGRIDIYKQVITLLKSSPVIGIGMSSIGIILGIGAHNVYLQLMCELGIIGGTIFILTFICSLILSVKILFILKNRYIDNDRDIYYGSVSIYIQIFFLIYGLTGNVISDNFISLTYLIATAILPSIYYHKKITLGGNLIESDRKVYV